MGIIMGVTKIKGLYKPMGQVLLILLLYLKDFDIKLPYECWYAPKQREIEFIVRERRTSFQMKNQKKWHQTFRRV